MVSQKKREYLYIYIKNLFLSFTNLSGGGFLKDKEQKSKDYNVKSRISHHNSYYAEIKKYSAGMIC